MKLSKLLENVGILSSEIPLEEEVTGITLDTRKGCEGALYAALPSLSDPARHGLDYVAAAKAGGAKAVLLDRDADTAGLPKILVRDARFAEAREFVTEAKQRRLASTAALWLAQNPTEKQPRFDVIEVYCADGVVHSINHIENAFEVAL